MPNFVAALFVDLKRCIVYPSWQPAWGSRGRAMSRSAHWTRNTWNCS